MSTTAKRKTKSKAASQRRRSDGRFIRVVHVDEVTLRKIVREEFVTGLQLIGVDLKGEESAIEMQKDMAYLRSWRKAVQAGGSRAMLALVSLAILGVVAAVISSLGFKMPNLTIPTS